MRILVVEDNEKNMKLFLDVLEAGGHATVAAGSAEQALELAAEGDVDLVLMDIRLPGVDGVEALRRLRGITSAPVLALTAQAMDGDRERFLSAGFDGYMSKPVDVRELLATVASLS